HIYRQIVSLCLNFLVIVNDNRLIFPNGVVAMDVRASNVRLFPQRPAPINYIPGQPQKKKLPAL
ncbi:MAG: hypothetical protein II754_01340, partial [Lachnospiraceae bacterium]|nr:hypothetical protein [Lachnospiraceae bacterium]